MSSESALTTGAMASKKASPSSSPRAWRMEAESASLVSGPVATMAGPAGSSVTSSRTTRMRGFDAMAAVIRCANSPRSTVSAVPPGMRDSRAHASSSDPPTPSASISTLSRPCAFGGSSLLKVLEQTISPSSSVLWASVPRTGRISNSVTSCPRSASCHAASEPESPPPTTVTSAISSLSVMTATSSTEWIYCRIRATREGPLPRPLPARSSRRGENSIPRDELSFSAVLPPPRSLWGRAGEGAAHHLAPNPPNRAALSRTPNLPQGFWGGGGRGLRARRGRRRDAPP